MGGLFTTINTYYNVIKTIINTSCIISFEYVKYKLFRLNTYDNFLTRLGTKLSRENVFYTKMAQTVSTSSSFCNKLTSFTDNVPYNEEEVDWECLDDLQNNAGIDIHKPYMPIKSGTISLIFNGTHIKDNKNVIIKIQRIGIQGFVEKSVINMSCILTLLSWLPWCFYLNINEIFNENKESMMRQLSFKTEVENIMQFYSKWNKPNLDYIKIPYVYEEITSMYPNVIVMERIFGTTLDAVCDTDRDIYANILAKFNTKSFFIDGIYHGDLHPGNILFIKNPNPNPNPNPNSEYTLGILDFGIVGSVNKKQKDSIYMLFDNIFNGDHVQVACTIVDDISDWQNSKIVKYDKSYLELIEILTNYSKLRFVKESVLLDTHDIIYINKILNAYGISLSKEFCRIELSFAISDSVCKLLSYKKTYSEQLLDIFNSTINNK